MKNRISILRLFVGFLAFVAAWFIWATSESVQASNDSEDVHVKAVLIANTKTVVPGKPFRLGVQLTMSPGWHTYYKEPGDAGMATKIVWDLPPGFSSSPLLWEKPKKFSEADIITYGYTGKTLIAAKIIPPNTLPAGKNLTFAAQVEWLSCKDLCVPGKTKVGLTLNIGNVKTAVNEKLFAEANFAGPIAEIYGGGSKFDVLQSNLGAKAGNDNLLIYYLLAFLGGIILNFMPCVLPVVAIKVLSLLEQTSQESTRSSTIAFASGIFSSFLFLGFLVIALQAAGHQIGWGFQFQQPLFLMVMSGLVLLFALGLFGLFDFSLSFGQKAVDQLAQKQGLMGDFFKGVLATILSTPCTAPFLGTALGFAFVEPWFVTLTIFAAVGAGMCLPYIILIIAPSYIRFLPKPGVWMEKLKEAFGFILLATTIWLLSILAGEVPNEQLTGFVYFLLAVSFAVWLMNRFVNLASSSKRIIVVRSIAAVIVVCAAYFCLSKIVPVTGTNAAAISADDSTFDIAHLNSELSSGKTVLLDFNARWCLTCQVNESTAINTTAVQEKLKELHAVLIKADWTRQDPTITALLKKFGRSGVPCYVIFPGKNPDKPILLPEIITQQMILDKLDEAGPSRDHM